MRIATWIVRRLISVVHVPVRIRARDPGTDDRSIGTLARDNYVDFVGSTFRRLAAAQSTHVYRDGWHYGEPWILTFDRATREACLRGGDAGWASAYPVRDGRVDGLILTPEEAAWLQACWNATRA